MFVRTMLARHCERVAPCGALAVVACLAMTTSLMAQGSTATFAVECAVKEIAVTTFVEDHGAAADLPAERLGEAGLTMQRARLTCYHGRVGEALALYESILSIGPVANKR